MKVTVALEHKRQLKLLIFAAILAISLAKEDKKREVEDSQAEASSNLELMKEGADLNVAASTYNSYVPPSQRPPKWEAPNYVPPQNTWQPPKPIQPVHTGVPANVQSDYYYPSYQPPSSTTPAVEVIKNEQYFGENGHYKYEYKIGDGTWVGEEGYYTDPKQTEESLVKKGWYSFVGADGKTYTTTYWADKSGYHAFGDHLPTPPPPPPAPQPDKIKPQYDEYPTQTQKPVYYPTQTPAPVYYPTKAPYIPPQQPFQPQPFPQAPVVPTLPSYQPPLQQYYPPQQNYYPQQQNQL